MALRLRRREACAGSEEAKPELVQNAVERGVFDWADPLRSWLQFPLAFQDPELEKKFLKKQSDGTRRIVKLMGTLAASAQTLVLSYRISVGQLESLHPQLRLLVILAGLMLILECVIIVIVDGYLREPASRERLCNMFMPAFVTLILLQHRLRSASLLSRINDDIWSASSRAELHTASDESTLIFLGVVIIAYHAVPFARCRSKWPAVFFLPAIYLALTQEAPTHAGASQCSVMSYRFSTVAIKAGGLALQSAIAFFKACQHELHVRKELEHEQHLESEQHVLTETQDALHAMLSSLWDASCVCNSDGMISSSTPQMDQLLAAGEELPGLSLCSFGADDSEARRLEDFLSDTAMSTTQQASRMQSTMQPRTLAVAATASNTRSSEFILHAIRLPAGAVRREQNSTQAFVFIGIKGAVDDLPDAEAADAFDCNLVQPNFIEHFRKYAGAVLQGEREEDLHSEIKSIAESSCPISWDISGASLAKSVELTLSSASEAGTFPRRCFDMSVQTESLSIHSVEVQTSTLPPRPPSGMALRQPTRLKRMPQIKSRKLLSSFRQTPTSTLMNFMKIHLQHFNVNGKVFCCKWHTAVLHLYNVSKAMFASECIHGFAPVDGWQCPGCLALNFFEEDEECDMQCSICGHFGDRDHIREWNSRVNTQFQLVSQDLSDANSERELVSENFSDVNSETSKSSNIVDAPK